MNDDKDRIVAYGTMSARTTELQENTNEKSAKLRYTPDSKGETNSAAKVKKIMETGVKAGH